jgi:hypothetical protein
VGHDDPRRQNGGTGDALGFDAAPALADGQVQGLAVTGPTVAATPIVPERRIDQNRRQQSPNQARNAAEKAPNRGQKQQPEPTIRDLAAPGSRASGGVIDLLRQWDRGDFVGPDFVQTWPQGRVEVFCRAGAPGCTVRGF